MVLPPGIFNLNLPTSLRKPKDTAATRDKQNTEKPTQKVEGRKNTKEERHRRNTQENGGRTGEQNCEDRCQGRDKGHFLNGCHSDDICKKEGTIDLEHNGEGIDLNKSKVFNNENITSLKYKNIKAKTGGKVKVNKKKDCVVNLLVAGSIRGSCIRGQLLLTSNMKLLSSGTTTRGMYAFMYQSLTK